MKTPLLAVAFAFVVAPCVIGCAEEEVQAGQAAFPENVGYTPPSNVPLPPAQNAPGQPPPSGPPVAQGEPAQGDGQGPPQDVTIGGQDGDEYADTDPSALTDFRSTLDPYGNWTDDPTYGTVWVPSQSVVGDNFTPYVSGGHWAYDDDYTWVSDYDWGWAPFHYGRWVYGPASWEWVPGRAYAGAWTSWRYGSGFVGWAPLPPTWGWRGGAAVGLGFVPSAPYAFVGTGHLFAPGLTAHLVGGPQAGLIAGRTQPFVPASPGVGAHALAHPAVGGPPPATLHIQAADVARVNASSDRGLAQARAFSRASTASSLGARAPAQLAARASASSGIMASGRGPSYNQSHFGGKLGAGFSAGSAYASPVRSRGFGGSSRPYFGSSSYSGAGHYSAPVRSSGGYSGFGGFHGGEPAGGGYHGGGGFSEGFHGGGGGFRSSGGGGFHGGGGGGGFHGGGGGGGRGGGRR